MFMKYTVYLFIAYDGYLSPSRRKHYPPRTYVFLNNALIELAATSSGPTRLLRRREACCAVDEYSRYKTSSITTDGVDTTVRFH